MNGREIPYQLRPNKFIDRQMFMELLLRLIVPRGPEKYIYASMGGRHLIDHYAAYNQLGIEALFSFDNNPNEVERQKFNRPTGQTECVELNSADLPSKIDEIPSKFSGRPNFIIWLDYTNADRRTQFQETIQTLVKLKHGDIFRITLNADSRTFRGAGEWKKKGYASPGQYRAEKLREQIPEYMPTDITAISDVGLPSALARCVELAAEAAKAQQSNLEIEPVLLTSYDDGTPMLTVTCAVSDAGSKERFPPITYSHWRFASKGWSDIRQIQVPVLSTKEQHRLDLRLHKSPKYMLSGFSFLPSHDEAKSLEALRSYREFHRFYPSFRHVED